MAGTEEYIDQIIENAITIANEYTDAAGETAQDVIDAADGISSLSINGTQASTDISAVEPDIPETTDSTYTYEAQLEKLVELLSGQLAEFYTTYYPLDADAFDEATNWLINSITNGGTGINAAIEEEIWQRSRDRVIADGQRTQQQIQLGYVAKGFSLPAGAMAQELRQSLFEQTTNTGIASTEIGKAQATMEVENIRFAVEQAISARMQAMNAAADYIRSIAASPDAAAKVAALDTDVQAKMMSATSDLYRARLTRDDMVMRTEIANAQNSLTSADLLISKQQKTIDQKVQAAAEAAGVFARVAASSLSSLNTIASTATNAFS